MPCYAIDGVIPVVSPEAYIHPTAVLIGDVIIEAGVYIGPFASLRADFGRGNSYPEKCQCPRLLYHPWISGQCDLG